MKKNIIVLALFFLVSSVFAQKTITAEGAGSSVENARTAAMAALSQSFSSSVQSSTEATRRLSESSKSSSLEQKILVQTNMPLFGVEYSEAKKGKGKNFVVTASIKSAVAAPIYKSEIEKIVKKIDTRYSTIDSVRADIADNEWQNLAVDYELFDKLEIAYLVLGQKNSTKPKLSSAEFRVLFERRARKVLTSSGHGQTEVAARSSALQEMSQSFSTHVQSSTEAKKSYEQSVSKNGKKDKTSTTSISQMDMRVLVTSDMPLYGVTFETSDNGLKGAAKEYTVIAKMDSITAIPQYKSEIVKIIEKIDARIPELDAFTSDKEESEWQNVAADYALLEKLEMACLVLGQKSSFSPILSSADFKIRYERHAREVTSIEKAAEKICASVLASSPKSKMFVYAPLFEGENTSTDFSNALANAVKSKLGKNLALTKITSDSYLKGAYYFAPGSVDGDDMVVTYYLCSPDGSVLASSGMVKIPYRVYSQYKYVPRNYDLQNEIASGRVSNPAFDVSIRVNGDRNSLDFKRGDSLTIEVRATSACYIYVLSYVYNDDGEPFSYLFPLEPYADGKEMFVRKISAKEANKWVVINPVIDGVPMDIEVIPPFGEETLHVFASTTDDFDDFVSKIPSYIETDDFYLVSGSPVQTVSKTRALNVKRVANKAAKVVNTAESTVSYSTHK